MTTQLGFADVGVDPLHFHTVQGFAHAPDHETILSGHLTREAARSMLLDHRHEVLSYEDQYGSEVNETSVTPDRIEYGETPDEDFQIGWLAIVECSRWDCRQQAVEQDKQDEQVA